MRTVRVKISSEAAGTIALTPVVVQELGLPALIDQIVIVTGKDAARVREVLKRGSIVSGTSRFRWDGIELDERELAGELARIPDANPGRPFDRTACVQIMLRGRWGAVPVTKDVGSQRRLFRRTSFWDSVLQLPRSVDYDRYAYPERADVYRWTLEAAGRTAIEAAADLLAYPQLRTRIRTLGIEEVDFYCRREPKPGTDAHLIRPRS